MNYSKHCFFLSISHVSDIIGTFLCTCYISICSQQERQEILHQLQQLEQRRQRLEAQVEQDRRMAELHAKMVRHILSCYLNLFIGLKNWS